MPQSMQKMVVFDPPASIARPKVLHHRIGAATQRDPSQHRPVALSREVRPR
jgi:hypothetical protein